jgi:hypothetical protein
MRLPDLCRVRPNEVGAKSAMSRRW